ncbi:alpha/beta hydrolase [Halieaceae bacterium IMCC14734]|uniref:Alpha/beta hydrolase n=1 Tax=Candidatus Litorirhabdus singularis TaxID=2518993 RepID=A0ABT3TDT3_9GAMM|nr:alpha/beta hydrolase [Candidatus Litorirhabdus singularis]MCX2980451.1 alpha/beta hydrolase [Candidatus Litorirhabdus singularis]
MIKWVVLVLLLVLTPYWWAGAGLRDLDEAARVSLGGQYLATPSGAIAYSQKGPEDAPVVILVHGFSTPKFVWDQVAPELVGAGYRVVSYDHLGRGYSERPSGPYDSSLYQAELTTIIDELELETPLALVGYSMGGANVVDFAASHPALVKQLILIAPAGYMGESSFAALLKLPLLGEWLTRVFGKAYALASIRDEVAAGKAPQQMLGQFQQQLQFKGYTDSLLSTLRHFPMGNLQHRYRLVGESNIPVTAIWGTKDKVVPYAGANAMGSDVPQLQLVTLDGGSHSITYSQPAEVAAELIMALERER